VQRALGYSLSGDCSEEVFFLCYGGGGNGKGLLTQAVSYVLGDYSDDVPFSTLEMSAHGPHTTNNDVAKLVNKRFVTAAETNAIRLNESRIKALTGRDPMTARFLYGEFFTFEPVAKFWLACNEKPEVHDTGEGFWRRVHMIPFVQTFTGARADTSLKNRLRAEAPGILRWMVDGCRMWQREGLAPPQMVRDATNEYRQESNQVHRFLNDRCMVDAGAKAQAGEIFVAFKSWCFGNQEKPEFNRTTFDGDMKKRFAIDDRGRHILYVGVGLVDQKTGAF
jgi:putative DNA primase/helicase